MDGGNRWQQTTSHNLDVAMSKVRWKRMESDPEQTVYERRGTPVFFMAIEPKRRQKEQIGFHDHVTSLRQPDARENQIISRAVLTA